MNKTFLFDGNRIKSVPLSQVIPDWLWGTKSKSLSEHGAFATVSWLYRALMLRCQAVSSMPYTLTRAGGVAVENWEFANALPGLLWLTEGALCLYGAAYWLRRRNRVRDLGYRWLLPSSFALKHNSDGTTEFKRMAEGKPQLLTPDDLVYFWEPALDRELGPGIGCVSVALDGAGLAYYVTQFAKGFFERGAIPATLLSVEGNPPDAELERLEQWWKRLTKGVKRAWETVAVRATVKPVIIGQPIKDLAMPELRDSARRDICVAMGIPQTMMEDSANYATAESHRKSFYEETILPRCNWLASVLNQQLFTPQGLTLAFQPEQLSIFQTDEAERAVSLKALTDAGIPLVMAMQMLGFALPEGMTYDELKAELDAKEKAKAEASAVAVARFQGQNTGNAPANGALAQLSNAGAADTGISKAAREDLVRWRKKAVKRGGAVDFESDVIPDYLAQMVKAGLGAMGLDAFQFLKAQPDARDEAEQRVQAIVGGVLQSHQGSVALAIVARQDVDYQPLSDDLNNGIYPIIAAIATEVALREAAEAGVEFDPAAVNAAALEWARSYTYDLVRGLVDTTRIVVSHAIEQFIATPGMTEGELEALLEAAFGAMRAQMIAITEVTRAYSAATNIYQDMLRKMGIELQRVWQTSHDEKVCPICGPLNGLMERDWVDMFSDGPPAHVRCRCWTTLAWGSRR